VERTFLAQANMNKADQVEPLDMKDIEVSEYLNLSDLLQLPYKKMPLSLQCSLKPN
jgi:hypothetical protein